MTWKALFLTSLMLTAAQVIGCQKRASFDPSSAGVFFPLQPRFSWTYRVIDRNRGTTNTFTDRVVEQKRTGSRGAGEVESQYSGPTGTLSSTILYVPESGYFTRQSGNGKSAPILFTERAFLPQQLKPDLTWSNSLVPFEDQAGTFHITQRHHTFFERKDVVVPAGRFSGCIRVETDAIYEHDRPNRLRLKYVDWYAPHVGLVKTLVTKSGFFSTELARVELLSFGYQQPKIAARLIDSAATSGVSMRQRSIFSSKR